MAKPILEHNGLALHKMEREDIVPFIANISDQNLREFLVLYDLDPFEALQEVVQQQMSHVIRMDGQIVAICGVDQGYMWSMFTKDIRKHWRKFVKASPRLVDFYHNFYSELFCEVWIENTFVLNWLVHLGFEPLEPECESQTIKFVRCNLKHNDIDSKESRPVMH